MARPRVVERLAARIGRPHPGEAAGDLVHGASEPLDGPFVVERAGCRLHYWTAGQGDSPMVFSHGYTMDHRMFDLQVRAFRRQHRVLVWDVRGHGLSKPLGDFSISACADDLAAILEHAGMKRPLHVGHSMGGYIVQELAFRRPEQVAAMVMLSTTCLTWRPPRVQTLGAPVTRALLGMWPHRWTTEQIGWIAGLSSRARRHAASAAAFMSKKERTRVWASVLDAYHHEPNYRIRCPLLIMHGDWDVVVGAGLISLLARGWAAREPNARYATIPRAAHNVTMDNPGFTNRAIRDFVRSAATTTVPLARADRPAPLPLPTRWLRTHSRAPQRDGLARALATASADALSKRPLREPVHSQERA